MSQHHDLCDRVLEALQSSSQPLSGEHIAHEQDVSRAAIWKCIKELRERGIAIDAKPHCGYQLAKPGDHLTKAGIESLLSEENRRLVNLCVKQQTESTNTDAKEWARAGAAEFSTVLANEQTKGKGRRGRSFASPAGTGVYASMVLRPSLAIPDTTILTALAGVAVCRALQSFEGCQPRIKWVNDVYLGTRKVCGILSEGEVDFESGGLAWVVVGIGVNAYNLERAGVHDAHIGHLFDTAKPGLRNKVAAAIIQELIRLYSSASHDEVIEQYRQLSFLTGMSVLIHEGDDKAGRKAHVNGISKELDLEVRYDSGDFAVIRSGDVSITPIWT